jgi:hypothetical protein
MCQALTNLSSESRSAVPQFVVKHLYRGHEAQRGIPKSAGYPVGCSNRMDNPLGNLADGVSTGLNPVFLPHKSFMRAKMKNDCDDCLRLKSV